eukprot:364873-Chlamydomonas_euryale.AAC.4
MQCTAFPSAAADVTGGGGEEAGLKGEEVDGRHRPLTVHAVQGRPHSPHALLPGLRHQHQGAAPHTVLTPSCLPSAFNTKELPHTQSSRPLASSSLWELWSPHTQSLCPPTARPRWGHGIALHRVPTPPD